MRLFIQGLCCAAIWVASPAFADPPNRQDHPRSQERVESRSGDVLGAVITAAERAVIGDYYRDHRADVGALPPGIRKKVARGKPLPPGIAKNFPQDLRERLPARPGYDYRSVGADVVLVEAASGVIVDVLKDILR